MLRMVIMGRLFRTWGISSGFEVVLAEKCPDHGGEANASKVLHHRYLLSRSSCVSLKALSIGSDDLTITFCPGCLSKRLGISYDLIDSLNIS